MKKLLKNILIDILCGLTYPIIFIFYWRRVLIPDIEKKRKRVLLCMLGCSKNRLTSFTTDDLDQIICLETIRAVSRMGDILLTIRLHPNQNIKELGKLPKSNCFLIKNTDDIYDAIRKNDLVMGGDSGVGLEAFLLKKPYIKINLTKRESLTNYPCFEVREIGGIESMIKKLTE